MTIRKLRIALAFMAVAVGVTAARATIITENVSVSPTSSGALGTLNFNFAQFDPTLGTLNSVVLTLTPTVGDMGSQIYNFGSPQVATFASVSNPSGSLSGLGLNALWSSSQSETINNYLAAAGVNNVSLPFTSFTITPSAVTVGPAGFAGNGTYTLALAGTSVATSGGSPGGSLFYGWYGNVGGNLEVEFNFTPVPEPTTMLAGALLLLPFGASTLRMLRKNRAA